MSTMKTKNKQKIKLAVRPVRLTLSHLKQFADAGTLKTRVYNKNILWATLAIGGYKFKCFADCDNRGKPTTSFGMVIARKGSCYDILHDLFATNVSRVLANKSWQIASNTNY